MLPMEDGKPFSLMKIPNKVSPLWFHIRVACDYVCTDTEAICCRCRHSGWTPSAEKVFSQHIQTRTEGWLLHSQRVACVSTSQSSSSVHSS